MIIWLYGLPGAGKTTTAWALVRQLRQRGVRVPMIDSDQMRQGPTADLGFDDIGRSENIFRLCKIARMIANRTPLAVVAAVTPRTTHRAMVKHFCDPLLLVRLVGRQRALWAGHEFEDGPADLTLDTSKLSPEECADQIINRLGKELEKFAST